jgi:urease accessory protein
MPPTPGQPADIEPQRVSAHARLVVAKRDGCTRISRLYQEGSANVRVLPNARDPLEAVLINTAGGLTGGDHIRWSVDVGAEAAAAITTQACEKIYRTDDGRAEAHCSLRLGSAARLAWLPQETIVFDHASFSRRLDADLDEGAQALFVEATVFGRQAMGESISHGTFRDRWRIRRNGRLLHAEDFAVSGNIATTLLRSAVTGGAIAVATVLLVVDDAADRLDAARRIIGDQGGASAWEVRKSGKLLAKLFAADSYSLRKRLMPLIELLNGQASLPKMWSI